MRVAFGAAAVAVAIILVPPAAAQVRLLQAVMARSVPVGGCTPAPTPVSSFLTTDPAAYLWFQVQGASARDVASSEWWTPAGRLLTSPGGAWPALEDPGSYCFSERLVIAGNPQAATGTWTVKIFWNGRELGNLQFTIQAAPQCSYNLSATSVSAPAAGTTGSVNVTAPAGCAWTATSNASWVTITSGASGSGNGTLQFTVAANTATTSRTGTLTVAGQTFTVTQAGAAPAGPRPTISAGGVLNGADYTPDIAPGMMVSIFGSNLAPRTTAAQAVPLPVELEGVSVEVLEAGKQPVRAPLYFVSAGQINIQMPFGITASSVQLRVRTAQGVSDPATVAIVPRAPRLFTRTMDGRGEPILLHATDYSWVSNQAPAKAGEYLVLLLTGLGEVSPTVEAGRPGGDDGRLGPINRVTTPVTVSFGEREVPALFAGLMPGFPGIYQINFQVPGDIEGGFQPLVVSAGGVPSQHGVAAAVQWDLPVVASGTVGSSGGVVKGGGVTVAIPPGAVAENSAITVYERDASPDPSGIRLSPIVTISGLPASLAAPVSVTLDVASAPPPGAAVEVVVRTQPGVRGIGLYALDAKVEGSRVTFQIPASPEDGAGPATASPRQATSLPAPSVIGHPAGFELAAVYAQMIWTVKSPSGKFVVKYHPLAFSASGIADLARLESEARSIAEQVSRAFDEAYKKLQDDLQLRWEVRTRWPVEVRIEGLMGKHADKWGMYQVSFWGVNYSNIVLNASRLAREKVSQQVRATIGHELFHLMQEQYDPRTRWKKTTEVGTWDWFLEALSTWFESIMLGDDSFIPATVRADNWAFLMRHGLEYPPGTVSAVQDHGYGASMFLRFLAKRPEDYPRLANVLTRMSARTSGVNPQPQLSPVAALRLDYPNLSDLWSSFVRAYMAGKGIYGGAEPFPILSELLGAAKGDRYYGFRTDADQGKTFEWASQDLSARLHEIDFRAQWLPGSVASLTLVDPEGLAEAIVYKQPGWRPLAVFRDTYTLENADQLAANRESLYVMVNNFRARAPYTGIRPIQLIVRRAGPPLTAYEHTRTVLIYNDSFRATVRLRVFGISGSEFQIARELFGPPRGEVHLLELLTPVASVTGPSEDRYTVTVTLSDVACVRGCPPPGSVNLVTKGAFGSEAHVAGSTFSRTVTVPRGGRAVSLRFSVVFSFAPLGGGAEQTGGSGALLDLAFVPQR
ncbi:MAG: hypothetical protein NZ554_08020 [Bryobacteraceae bacterium]|nr:hypothetical protein [Bryobacteraceae bacterium]